MANETKHEHEHEHSEEVLELREEELAARKDTVETGQVRIHKDVVEESHTLEVPVSREEVTIERRPVEGRAAEGSIGDDSATLRVPVHEEQVSVEKRAVVTEEISVGKQQVQETVQVSDTVRREEVRVDRDGDVEVEERR